jgi:glycosyltransferase involved in cell wall biosynthesis
MELTPDRVHNNLTGATFHFQVRQDRCGWSNPGDDRLLLAQTLREVNIQEDVLFHPELDPRQAIPSLRAEWSATPGAYLRRIIAEMTAFEPGPGIMTCGPEWSARSVLSGLSDHWSGDLPSKEEVGREIESAAWFVINLLLHDDELCRRFPLALSAGVEGEFCNWLCAEGIIRHDLPQDAAQTTRAAFTSEPGYPVSRLIDFQGFENPLFRVARIPSFLSGLGTWLFENGSKYRISKLQAWWFLFECAEDPARELVRVYLTNPAWQKHFPDAMSRRGWKRLIHWVRERYRFDATFGDDQSPWQTRSIDEASTACRSRLSRADLLCDDDKNDLSPSALLEPSDCELVAAPEELSQWIEHVRTDQNVTTSKQTGLNVLGHFCTPCGLQAAAVSIVRSLQSVGVSTSCRDMISEPHIAVMDRSKYLGIEVFDTTLIHTQPGPYFESCYARAGLTPRSDVNRIAFWAWEFEQAPADWRRIDEPLDEIWATSSFVGRAIRAVVGVPVFDLFHGIDVGQVTPFDRARLGIPQDHTFFLFIFDAGSVTERKNPLGLITAFRRAFRFDDKVTLVIKAAGLSSQAEEGSRLRAEARGVGAVILEQVLSRAELNGLIQACDCYVSLHRSEGFGMTMAEAMMLGRPVIATGYSGNLEFMDKDNSLLISCKLVPVGRQIGPYSKDWHWAEPSVTKAAEAMRWVHENLDDARALGAKARVSAEATLSLVAAGKRFARRLEQIRMNRTSKHDSAAGAVAVSESHTIKGLA